VGTGFLGASAGALRRAAARRSAGQPGALAAFQQLKSVGPTACMIGSDWPAPARRVSVFIPASRNIASSIDGRPTGIPLPSRAAAAPPGGNRSTDQRAYRSARILVRGDVDRHHSVIHALLPSAPDAPTLTPPVMRTRSPRGEPRDCVRNIKHRWTRASGQAPGQLPQAGRAEDSQALAEPYENNTGRGLVRRAKSRRRVCTLADRNGSPPAWVAIVANLIGRRVVCTPGGMTADVPGE
jgi:hypothetical protein